MNEQQITELLRRYNDNELSPEERIQLDTWYLKYVSESKAELSAEQEDRMMARLRQELPLKYPRRTSLWLRWSVAASLITILGLGLFYFRNNTKNTLVQGNPSYANDIEPGKNTATLTLANGKTINLSDAKTGLVVGISKLTYADGSSVDSRTSLRGGTLTAATPRGGTYQLTLPDGTKVWLNAASSIQFPANFARLAARKVSLSGEAYFEVAKDRAHPFVVTTNGQQVEVLGTHFNISSYPDELSTKTTLLEGHVKVSNGHVFKLLNPGQQAVLTKNDLLVSNADRTKAIAWKEGNFIFNGENIRNIMPELARWYNIEVDYQGKVSTDLYYANISRNKKISEILASLEKAKGVHFKIEGRRVTVTE